MMESKEAKRTSMLAIRLSALGDVAMTVPALYSFARQNPNVDVTVLTTPFFARLFIDAPANISVMPVDLKKDYHGFAGLCRLARRLRKMNFDYVADLHDVLRSRFIGLWLALTGSKLATVDKNRRERRRLLSHKATESRRFTDRYCDVFRALGFNVNLDFKTIFEQKLPSCPLTLPDKSIGIAPFARYVNKAYPVDMVKQLVEMLTDRGYHIYLFGGGKEEKKALAEVAAGNPKVMSLAGVYPLEDELAVMARLDLMISMDSANQHLASLVGTKVLSIWGSTTPACGFMGYNQPSTSACVAGLNCQPCTIAGSNECPAGTNYECLRALHPEIIVKKAVKLLGDE